MGVPGGYSHEKSLFEHEDGIAKIRAFYRDKFKIDLKEIKILPNYMMQDVFAVLKSSKLKDHAISEDNKKEEKKPKLEPEIKPVVEKELCAPCQEATVLMKGGFLQKAKFN